MGLGPGHKAAFTRESTAGACSSLPVEHAGQSASIFQAKSESKACVQATLEAAQAWLAVQPPTKNQQVSSHSCACPPNLWTRVKMLRAHIYIMWFAARTLASSSLCSLDLEPREGTARAMGWSGALRQGSTVSQRSTSFRSTRPLFYSRRRWIGWGFPVFVVPRSGPAVTVGQSKTGSALLGFVVCSPNTDCTVGPRLKRLRRRALIGGWHRRAPVRHRRLYLNS